MKPLTIGVSGGTASGKSTFSRTLESRLSEYKVKRIKMDDYYYRPPPPVVSPITQESRPDFNSPGAADYEKPLNLIKTIQADCSFDVIIAEGVFLFCYDEMRPLFDLKIFIDLDADTRMYRRIRRNTDNFTLPPEGERSIESNFEYYLHFAKFQEKKFSLPSVVYADIILNGYKLDGIAVDILIAWIERRLQKI